jgi:hypothetical protein
MGFDLYCNATRYISQRLPVIAHPDARRRRRAVAHDHGRHQGNDRGTYERRRNEVRTAERTERETAELREQLTAALGLDLRIYWQRLGLACEFCVGRTASFRSHSLAARAIESAV